MSFRIVNCVIIHQTKDIEIEFFLESAKFWILSRGRLFFSFECNPWVGSVTLRVNERDFLSLKSDSVMCYILIKVKDNKSRPQKSGHCLDYVTTAWVIISSVYKLLKQIILHICKQTKTKKSADPELSDRKIWRQISNAD